MSEKQLESLFKILDKGLKKFKKKLKKKELDFNYEVNIESWDIQPVRSNATISQM
jgi:hypothetical protein